MTDNHNLTRAQRLEREREMREKLCQLAAAQGVVLVQVSPKRHLVVRVNRDSSVAHRIEGDYFTWSWGEVVCGPTHWMYCLNWIRDNVRPVPDELKPR
jgi:hypothetical protein